MTAIYLGQSLATHAETIVSKDNTQQVVFTGRILDSAYDGSISDSACENNVPNCVRYGATYKIKISISSVILGKLQDKTLYIDIYALNRGSVRAGRILKIRAVRKDIDHFSVLEWEPVREVQ